VYSVGDVPAGGDRVYPYAVLSVSFDDADAYTLDSRRGLEFYRLTTQAFGRTLNAAVDTDARMRAVFQDNKLAATGWICAPIRVQVAGAVVNDPDAGQVIGVTSTYLFTAKKVTP